MATIKDIAEKAGVSISSVSRVLRGDPTLSISSEKRKIILQVAEELSYEYKVTLKKNYPLLVINNQTKVDELENYHYFDILNGIEKRAKTKGLNLIYYNNKNIDSNVRLERYVSGIIAIGKFRKEDIKLFSEISDSIVFIDSCPDNGNFDAVLTDCHFTIRQVIDYYINKGHHHIGFIGQGDKQKIHIKNVNHHIESAFYFYMKEKNLLNETYIYLSKQYMKDLGYHLMKQAIGEHGSQLPTAFFVIDDFIAGGCIRALHEESIEVPSRVNVIGMYNTGISNLIYPPLTSVDIHPEIMGETAVDLLIERLNGRKVAKTVYISTKLIKRQSSF